jgi:hypothetical protein
MFGLKTIAMKVHGALAMRNLGKRKLRFLNSRDP